MPTATTTIHHTDAPRWAFTVRVISITASFSVSAHGETGVIATVGADIASAGVEEDVMSLVAETEAAGFMQRIVDVHRGKARTAVAGPTVVPV